MSDLVLGLDIGGSKTHAILADGDAVLADVLAGSANPASVGLEEASRQLAAVFGRLGPVGIGAICAGVAGAAGAGGGRFAHRAPRHAAAARA